MGEDQIKVLEKRVQALEAQLKVLDEKVDRLLIIFERGSGAWWILKLLGTTMVGVATVWAVISGHLYWR